MSLKLLERQISEITSPVDSLESTVNASIETKVQAELQSWFAAFLQQMEESSQIPNILHSDRTWLKEYWAEFEVAREAD
ncbi:unnamed protein product [Ilex paraguariensis]|uniref:Uncharacterized protein n=1 Tax=Ilex paraguariensis TaxID=185542 RepID=A0ABC8REB2_9AQUA